MPDQDAEYALSSGGIYMPRTAATHRDDEYDPIGFDVLLDMQRRHFWYVGRHRFLLHALRAQLHGRQKLSGLDAGGGCGGWLAHLAQHEADTFAELALADSSRRALELAGPVLGDRVKRYQVDLLDTRWRDRWDVIFLLDVIEHIPNHDQVFAELRRALKPGGLLIVTAPALQFFWSYNDEMVHHVRRYSRGDLAQLAQAENFEVLRTRYFMFLLSPLLMLSRWKRVDVASMSREQVAATLRKTHRVPIAPVNALLAGVFSLETPLGRFVPFPWGTSVLGVFRKPLHAALDSHAPAR
ncbi:MAG: methyltransferase domain-containing protein [Anaerolineae bacterium]|nr:methyltransferase domain-containing protein [Phycisphaerae bacterium]